MLTKVFFNVILNTLKCEEEYSMQKAMKKVSVFAVIILTLLMSLFYFTSCGEKGVYKMTSYKVGNTTTEVDSSAEEVSFVELKKGNVATLSINLVLFSIDTDGTWKREDDNIIITAVTKNSEGEVTSSTEYKMKIDGKKLVWTLDVGISTIVMTFEKE